MIDYICEAVYGEDQETCTQNPKTYTLVGLIALQSLLLVGFAVSGFLGAYSVSSLGAAVIISASGAYLLKLAFGHLRERSIYVIGISLVATAFITIGALGCAGILSGSQLGWGIVGISLGSVVVKSIFLALNNKIMRS